MCKQLSSSIVGQEVEKINIKSSESPKYKITSTLSFIKDVGKMYFLLQLCICMYIFSVDSIKVDEMSTAGTVH